MLSGLQLFFRQFIFFKVIASFSGTAGILPGNPFLAFCTDTTSTYSSTLLSRCHRRHGIIHSSHGLLIQGPRGRESDPFQGYRLDIHEPRSTDSQASTLRRLGVYRPRQPRFMSETLAPPTIFTTEIRRRGSRHAILGRRKHLHRLPMHQARLKRGYEEA
ncbi:hypothetical protein BDR22DRAFT_498611 [Usnea florida]